MNKRKTQTESAPSKIRSNPQRSFSEPARTFEFTHPVSTGQYDNNDEIVLIMTESNVKSRWVTYLYDEDLGTSMHPEDAVFMLNRGDYMLVTNDSDHYPKNSSAKTLRMVDNDVKICFYKRKCDEDGNELDGDSNDEEIDNGDDK